MVDIRAYRPAAAVGSRAGQAPTDNAADDLTADEWVDIAVEVLDQTQAERALVDLGDLFDECLDDLRAQATTRNPERR